MAEREEAVERLKAVDLSRFVGTFGAAFVLCFLDKVYGGALFHMNNGDLLRSPFSFFAFAFTFPLFCTIIFPKPQREATT